MTRISLATLAATVLLLALSLGAAGTAEAASSTWTESYGAKMRLVAAGGGPMPDGRLAAGFEVRLNPGWKTYWRYPGDSGVSPEFSFAGSRNVESVEVLFPAPNRYVDAGIAAIGYKKKVIFPLLVRPRDPDRPIRLALQADLGVCEQICVPVRVDAEVEITPGSPPDRPVAAAIETALKRVPRHLTGEAAERAGTGLALLAIDVDDSRSPPLVTAKLRLATASAEHDLFVEGPGDDWYLPLPEKVAVRGDVAIYRFELDGLPPRTSPRGATLRFTLVNGDAAVEQEWRLP